MSPQKNIFNISFSTNHLSSVFHNKYKPCLQFSILFQFNSSKRFTIFKNHAIQNPKCLWFQSVVPLNLLLFDQVPLIVVICKQFKELLLTKGLSPPLIKMDPHQQVTFNSQTIFIVVAFFSMFLLSFCLLSRKPALLR